MSAHKSPCTDYTCKQFLCVQARFISDSRAVPVEHEIVLLRSEMARLEAELYEAKRLEDRQSEGKSSWKQEANYWCERSSRAEKERDGLIAKIDRIREYVATHHSEHRFGIKSESCPACIVLGIAG